MRKLIYVFLILVIASPALFAKGNKADTLMKSSTFSGLKFRSIGPAWNSGRIADFAVNPANNKEYYVATASGNLWKTGNDGITWEAIGDTLPYSLGCVEIDPNNHHVVWVGSGENNSQRAIGYGDGVYKSTDDGKTWKNMGLKNSRQIGNILIDPRNSDVVFVAAEGSIWGPGGDRGLYKTEDGGKTWKKVLSISKNTGVRNVVFDPRNPDILYAVSHQRRRHVYTKINGGPESAVYKSTDAGKSWKKIMKGLPKVDLGGMGIAVSPVNPDVIYLSVEAAYDKGGFYRSTNMGESWERMSNTFSSGQYFNEVYCDPKNVDKVYLTDVRSKFTVDAGKTWKTIGVKGKHVDDHAIWIDPEDTDHILFGCDGGIYETYDGTKNWEFKPNLPVTQFYRVSLDNKYPFYNIYGGTQDNQSMGGPSRTISRDGIVNSDWIMTVGGDGFFQAVDPTNPNIVYSEWQYGNIVRFDKKSREVTHIRPEPAKGEKSFKWYWDAPFFISPHSHTRLYIAAERVFRSDDRGESWQEISGDLSTKKDRNSFKVMGKYWSYDAVAKDVSTSLFGLIVSLTESPVKENLLYAGTDDGLIQVSEDAKTWRKIKSFPGVPKYTFVSDILPSQYDENVVYATFNNFEQDDFTPYVLKSINKGKSWKSIAGNLPKNGAVNTIVEDPVNRNLLFVGTEWGVYFTTDGGENWVQLKSGLPKVKVPDIAIQKRENDLVLATFGRGFYVLDDYSPLRKVSKEFLRKDAYIFPIKDALMYHMSSSRYGQGATYFKAPNPPFGAVFTYYLKEVPKTLKQIRKEKEKKLFKKGKPIPQPSYDEIRKEKNEVPPYLVFTVSDNTGKVVRKITSAPKKGINRVVWDLKYDSFNPVTLKKDKFNATAKQKSSLLALPGKYSVTMSMVYEGKEKQLAGPKAFTAKILNNTTLPAKNMINKIAFERKALDLARKVVGAKKEAAELSKRVEIIKQTINNTSGASFALMQKVNGVSDKLKDLLFKFNGQPAKASLEEIPPSPVPLSWRVGDMLNPTWNSSSEITRNQSVAYDILKEELPNIVKELKTIKYKELKAINIDLENIGAPWTPGRIPE